MITFPRLYNHSRSVMFRFICLLLIIHTGAIAQDRIFRHINTQVVRTTTSKKYPDYSKALDQLDDRLKPLLTKVNDKQVYLLPVTFHILVADGQKMPDQNMVQAQIDILNQHFGRYSPITIDYPNEEVAKYATMGADVGIQFVLTPTTNSPTGIELVKTERKSWDLSNQIQDPKQGGVAPVDPDHMINIWIGELADNNAGYAHMPGAPAEIDGIVIDPDFFGNEKGTAKSPYAQGKTLVHLMGTYLGLNELWDEQNPCKDDGVADTPLHSGPTVLLSTDKNHRQICFCPGAPLAMYMNFMDNTDDAQLILFTPGQRDRMRAVLSAEGLRPTLVKR